MIATGDAESRNYEQENSDRRVVKIREMILQDPTHTVESLAGSLKLSVSHIQHKFKSHTGLCLREHIGEVRMSRAAHLLATTDKQIKEIADELGYAHTSCFIRCFQQHHGMTPLQYRNSAQQ